MTTSIITYTYSSSPYSQKILATCALAGVKPQNVEVDAVLPRPELELLHINYRRIPIMFIGKDCYVDSQAIIDKLSKMTTESLFPQEHTSSLYALKILGDQIFKMAQPCVPMAALSDEFVEDRKAVFPILLNPNLRKLRPHGLSEMKALLAKFETEYLQHQDWLLGDKISLGDVHVAWALVWFLFDLGNQSEPGFGPDRLPKVHDWLSRYRKETKMDVSSIDAKEAQKTILSGEYAKLVIEDDPLEVRVGDMVSVYPTDAEPTHLTTGTLRALSARESVVELENGIRVHSPRIGQRIIRAGDTTL